MHVIHASSCFGAAKVQICRHQADDVDTKSHYEFEHLECRLQRLQSSSWTG